MFLVDLDLERGTLFIYFLNDYIHYYTESRKVLAEHAVLYNLANNIYKNADKLFIIICNCVCVCSRSSYRTKRAKAISVKYLDLLTIKKRP